MNKTYFIADLHFGHQNIINMCNRPFVDIEDMKHQLINKWNNKVSDNDTVYILGDLSFKMSKEEIIKILKKLNGNKILIKGNHDKYIGQRDFDECFKEIHNYLQIVGENKEQIILCHYPIIDFAGMYHGAHMVYGHIHNKYIPHKNMYCASVECIDYEPVTFDEIKKIYKDKEVEEEIDWAKIWK